MTRSRRILSASFGIMVSTLMLGAFQNCGQGGFKSFNNSELGSNNPFGNTPSPSPAPTPSPPPPPPPAGRLSLAIPANGARLAPAFVQPMIDFEGQCETGGQPVVLQQKESDGFIKKLAETPCASGSYFTKINAFNLQSGLVTLLARQIDSAGVSHEASSTLTIVHPGIHRFTTGFGAGLTSVNESSGPSLLDITGRDNTRGPSHWLSDLEANPLGAFAFQYEGGNSAQRSAALQPERDNPSNQVLRYTLSDNNVYEGPTPKKGRIQATLSNMGDIKEFYYKVRMRLGSDFDFVRKFNPPVTWLTIAEFWNQGGWTADAMKPELKGFRISMMVAKPNTGPGPLRFIAHGQWKDFIETEDGLVEKWNDIWEARNNSFEVPLNQWVTLEYYFKEGDARTGRFVVAATVENGPRQVIFEDVGRLTKSPNMPVGDGLNHLHPLKLYTGKYLLTPLKEAGKSLIIEWDDFDIWTGQIGP